MKKYYAYFIPRTGKTGVTDDWAECELFVARERGARFKSFRVRKDAEEWLGKGAQYVVKQENKKSGDNLEHGLYFDAGTGRGVGLVEVNVTDAEGESQLYKILSPRRISHFGTHIITMRSATNNYGELLALKFALKIALQDGIKQVFGDSKLIIDYWSKGYIKKGQFKRSVYRLVDQVVILKRVFEEGGGIIRYVSGDVNPADLGFHR